MTPNWEDAPEWANYVAMDRDGEWFWYENKPIEYFDHWENNGGKFSSVDFSDSWRVTLESRPEK